MSALTRCNQRPARLQGIPRLNGARDDIQPEIVNLGTELSGIGFNRPARLSISRAFISPSHGPLSAGVYRRDLLSTREARESTRREF